jgi:hypothetical protein
LLFPYQGIQKGIQLVEELETDLLPLLGQNNSEVRSLGVLLIVQMYNHLGFSEGYGKSRHVEV